MDKSVLDIDDLMERVQDDRDLLLELLDIYQQDYPQKRKILDAAVEKKNAEEVDHAAHAIKGASGNISAKKMHATCLEIEKKGKAGDLSGVADLLSRLDQEYLELQQNIAEYKKNNS